MYDRAICNSGNYYSDYMFYCGFSKGNEINVSTIF